MAESEIILIFRGRWPFIERGEATNLKLADRQMTEEIQNILLSDK